MSEKERTLNKQNSKISNSVNSENEGIGFSLCTNIENCNGYANGTPVLGYGFYGCENINNCTGSGYASSIGYSFYEITRASNCRNGGSTTNMWGGTNTGIDISAYKTVATISNTTLNA